jgi:hypothetical protein
MVKRFRSSYIIILVCLILSTLKNNFDYYIGSGIDNYLIFLYFYLSIVFFDIGVRFNVPTHKYLEYVPLTLAAIAGIQVAILILSSLDQNFSLYLTDRGIEPTRISLGNALEAQITLTLVAYAFQKHSKNKGAKLATLFILLISNAVAQTRILIVCSFAMLVRSLFKFSYKWLVFGLAFGVLVMITIGEYFQIERLTFNDLVSGGSTLDRLNLLFISIDLISTPEIIFGYGAGGFSYYHENAFGIKKSVENAIIQMLIEFGLVGFVVFFLCISKSINIVTKKQKIDPILIILLLQVAVMMPINAMLPVQAFLIGIIYASKH